MNDKRRKYLRDDMHNGIYVRAWKEGRGHGEYMVQVWWKPKPEGDPDGDWAMPGEVGLPAAVEQAIINTRQDVEEKASAALKKIGIGK